MTGAHRSRRAARATLWLPGLAVALGAAAATAHGLYQVALAAAVPAGIAWLYPLITDGLALVAYSATNQLTGSAARYAWAVVITAAGLSGLAQAVYLASGATLNASPTLRFGIGAWPAVAAAIAAHLLYLLAAHNPTERPHVTRTHRSRESAHRDDNVGHICPADPVQPSRRPTPAAQDSGRDRAFKTGRRSSPTPLSNDQETASTSTIVTPARARAHAAALQHAERHGALPTVSALAAAAKVSRGTAATVLKPLRSRPRLPR